MIFPLTTMKLGFTNHPDSYKDLIMTGPLWHMKLISSSACLLGPKKKNLMYPSCLRDSIKVYFTQSPIFHNLSCLEGGINFVHFVFPSRCNQVEFQPNSGQLTAFLTEGKLVEYLKMPSRYNNAASVFCRLMDYHQVVLCHLQAHFIHRS